MRQWVPVPSRQTPLSYSCMRRSESHSRQGTRPWCYYLQRHDLKTTTTPCCRESGDGSFFWRLLRGPLPRPRRSGRCWNFMFKGGSSPSVRLGRLTWWWPTQNTGPLIRCIRLETIGTCIPQWTPLRSGPYLSTLLKKLHSHKDVDTTLVSLPPIPRGGKKEERKKGLCPLLVVSGPRENLGYSL